MCMWKFSSRLLLDDHLWIPPSGFWSLKEITFVPNISYQGAQLSASTYLSLYFFPIYSIHFLSSPCFYLCLISSQRSVSYPPRCHIFTMRHLWTEHIWILAFTHAAVIVLLPSAIWRWVTSTGCLSLETTGAAQMCMFVYLNGSHLF